MSSTPPLSNTHARPRISPPNRPLRASASSPSSSSSSSPSSSAPASPSQAPLANDDRCVYRATACSNPRARKASGERHAFCQFHLRQTSLTQRAAQCQRKQSKTLLFRDPSRVPAALLRQVPQTKRPAQSVPQAPLLPRLRSHDVLRRALLMDTQRLPLLATAAAALERTQSVASPTTTTANHTTTRLPSIRALDASCRREWTQHLAPICVPRSPRPEDASPRVLPSLRASSPALLSRRLVLSNSTSP